MQKSTERQKIVKCNTPTFDSMSLRIEFKECQIIDKRLTSETCTYYESIQLMDSELSPPKPIILSQNGITIRIKLVEIPIYNKELNQKIQTKFIVLTLSAKLLRENYFEGITKNNISTVYTEFMDLNIFKCSFETFIKSKASDIDVCENRYFDSSKTFQDILKYLVQSSGTKYKYLNLFNKEFNSGLDFNTRYKATPSLPYLKFYFKEWELKTKSQIFYFNYLNEYVIENLGRIEATIKNYKHKKRLEEKNILPKFETLEELLLIPSKNLHQFLIYSLNAYITTTVRMKNPKLTPMDHLIFESIKLLITKGFDYDSILNMANHYEGTKEETARKQKIRMKNKLTELFDLTINKDSELQKKAQTNQQIQSYLNHLGVFLN